MNIQIFGTKKSFDTKKAQRFFKERGIKFQFVDLSQNAMSKGEFLSIRSALKFNLEQMLDTSTKAFEDSNIAYLAREEAKIEKILDDETMLRQPFVRNGKKATVGVDEATWKKWIEEDK